MKFITKYALLALLLVSQTNLLTANEEVTISTSSLQKIYVSPAQLHIIQEGIFFLNAEGNLEPACGVFSDSLGIYVMAPSYQCPVCKTWNRTGKCIKTNCPMYGK